MYAISEIVFSLIYLCNYLISMTQLVVRESDEGQEYFEKKKKRMNCLLSKNWKAVTTG